MKITDIVHTEWLIIRVMRELRALPGVRSVSREPQTPRHCTVVAHVSDTERYEFYFARYSGRCGVVKVCYHHPYTDIISLRGGLSAALRSIGDAAE